jgi:hypothetical protein
LKGAEKEMVLDIKIYLVGGMGVDGTGSGSCSMTDVGIIGVKHLGCALSLAEVIATENV